MTTAGVLAGVSSGHAARDGGVYRFDGSRFEPVVGLPDRLDGAVGPGRIAGHGDHAALVAPRGDVYVSVDGGRSWHLALRVEGATDVAVAPLPVDG